MRIETTHPDLRRSAAAVTIFLLVCGVAGLWASGNQEMKLKKGKINLGAVHITFEPSYLYQGVEYNTFDRAYRREIDQIAREHNVNFIHVEGGSDIDPSGYAVQELLDLGVDGIVIFQNEPGMAPGLVAKAQAAGVPVIVHGLQPQQPEQVPSVDFDEYGSCEDLGKAVAENLFLRNVVTGVARVLVLSTRTDQTDTARADGFVAGFRSLVPGAQFLNQVQTTGNVESAAEIVAASLEQTPRVNIIFATTDLQAEGAMAALNRFSPGDPERNVILASVGGSREAMLQLLQPNSPWKAEVGLAIRDFADQSYKVMTGMIKGEIPMRQDKAYLVKSPVFVQPTREQVQQYLQQNHDEQLPPDSGK
jgi:ABC-type sugar transport system substrate-binding protein